MVAWFRRSSRRVWSVTAVLAAIAAAPIATLDTLEAAPPSSLGPSVVSVSGRQLIVQRRTAAGTLAAAAPFIARGVNYSPASHGTNTSPTDPNNAQVRRPEFGAWWPTDAPLLQSLNANVVRLYLDPGFDATLGPDGLAMLDAFYERGIMVIMTVDDAVNDLSRLNGAVNYYKDHPAILMWMLGSEWNINRYFGQASSVLDAAQRTENAAASIKMLDPNHPVATSYGDIDIDAAGLRLADTANYVNNICPSVDVWALNVYRGDTFGTLFSQWGGITSKPMIVGEYGIDAFATTNPGPPPVGGVDEAAQASFVVSLWNDIYGNLSAIDPAHVAIGGLVFEFNDEWWKVPPAGVHDSGGWASAAFPDGIGNEEYFGLVSIDRVPRLAFNALQAAMHPSNVGVPSGTFAASSLGGFGATSFARFFKSQTMFFNRAGGAGGGRGFNVAVVDPVSRAILDGGRNFDTWATRDTGTAMLAMIDFLDTLPNGVLVMISAGDDAGLNQFPPNDCVPLAGAWVAQGKQAIAALGSTTIGSYCYRDSFALVAIKGTGVACAEDLGHLEEALATCTLNEPPKPVITAPAAGSSLFVNTPSTIAVTASDLDGAVIRVDFFANGAPIGSDFAAPFTTSWTPAAEGEYTLTAIATDNANATLTSAPVVITVIVPAPAIGDVDGDRRSDLLVFRSSTGHWFDRQSLNDFNIAMARDIPWGEPGDIPVSGDFDGDLKADFVVWRPSNGAWFLLYSSEQYSYTAARSLQWGEPGDIPLVAEIDGDHKADLVVYRPSNGMWFILESSTNYSYASATTYQWGLPGDQPLSIDIDGDGRTEIAVWRPGTGEWFIRRSSDNYDVTKWIWYQWGLNGDIPVASDFDGDGKTDLVVYRPSNGFWYARYSQTAYDITFFTAIQWGLPGDQPLPGDFDGDGKSDITVWRPSSGHWFVLLSSGGFTYDHWALYQWGISGDVPFGR